MAGSFTLTKALPLSKRYQKDTWRQAVRIELLDPKASTQQTPDYTSKHNTTDNLELTQLRLEKLSTLSPTLNQQIMTELDNPTRELLQTCSIDAYFWSQNSFIRISCYNFRLFSYLKRHKKWLFYLRKVIHKLVAEVKKIEVIYQEGEKLYIFYRILD
ncbi:hypothetical protein [Fischerella sp. JS2]|uniref:hypothetical protein n=1 Tax=Fischerella sp. JS2 TaxID=2597771 RepID=UPI0028E9861E|nr:hypothetical protein [Fischerella sp. JS2]